MDPILQRLDDENEIRKLVLRFSLGMDTRDVGLFRAAWADEVELDLHTLAKDVIPLSGTRRADEYARDVIALLSGFTATQHVSTNHLIAVDGDTATCTCYTLATHYLRRDAGESWLTAGSRYELVALRTRATGWRFTRFALRGLWTSGDRSIWQAVGTDVTGHRRGLS
jgi:hypothetical protein